MALSSVRSSQTLISFSLIFSDWIPKAIHNKKYEMFTSSAFSFRGPVKIRFTFCSNFVHASGNFELDQSMVVGGFPRNSIVVVVVFLVKVIDLPLLKLGNVASGLEGRYKPYFIA